MPNDQRNPMPVSASDLTTDWLTAAMAPHTDGAQVTQFETTTIGAGEGFMGELVRVDLTLTPHHATPRSLIAKFAAPRADTREMAERQQLYQRELGFYRDIGDEVGVPVAKCYFSEMQGNRFVLLLEDLAPSEPVDQVKGADRETSMQVIEQFATLHAKWWNSAKLADYDWAKWVVDEVPLEEGLAQIDASLKEAEQGKFDAYPEMKRLMPLLRPLFRVKPQPPHPFSLTHGDLRADNIIRPSLAGGRFAIIDWQLCGKGDPVNDIARWLVQSITIEDRRATETTLLKRYHELLLAGGVKGYSFRALQNSYKLNLVVMLLMFSMSMDAVDQSSDRAKALFHEFYARLDAALVDWQVEGLLKALPYLVPFLNLANFLKAKLSR